MSASLQPRAAAAALVLALAVVGPARGADTAPTLSLGGADAFRGAAGVLLRLEATLPHGDLVQLPMQIQLLVRELGNGTDFIRFELPSGAFGGSVESLAGGLDALNVFEVLGASGPSGARLVGLRPERIEVLLPSDFPEGPAEAQLFFVYVGEPVFSNPIGFDVPAGATP